jgi:multiple sugar transport system permease protein
MRYLQNRVVPVLMLAPATALFILTVVVPLAMVVSLSLYETNLIRWTFAGVRNYVTVLSAPAFVSTLFNTVLYMLFIVPLSLLFSLPVALLIHFLPRRAQFPARVVVYAPVLTSGIIISNVWRWIFSPRAGMVNWLLSLVGMEPILWFSTRWNTIPTIAFIHCLTNLGSGVILYTAALKSIGPEVHDAARIDGARTPRLIRCIYLPAIAPTIALLLLFNSIGSMQIFEWIYMLAQHRGAITVTYQIYHEAFLYSRHGLGAAQSVVLIVIISTLAFAQRRFQTWQSM